MFQSFNSRESYLEAIAQWKEDYAQHSDYIRELKRDLVVAHREFSKDSRKSGEVWSLIYSLRDAKQKATGMISERHQSKQDAQAQYLAAREQKAA